MTHTHTHKGKIKLTEPKSRKRGCGETQNVIMNKNKELIDQRKQKIFVT